MFWGIAGAAIGVTVAMAVLTVSMQELVRRSVRLSWREMIAPQLPALACTALMVGALIATLRGLAAVAPHAAAWQQMLVLGLVGTTCYIAFVLFSPFLALHELVLETSDDLLPAPISRGLRRLGVGPSSGAH
jgi:hypothetical protein